MWLRDLFRFFVMLIALVVLEIAYSLLWQVEPRPFAHLQLVAAFGVVLWAIREGQDDA